MCLVLSQAFYVLLTHSILTTTQKVGRYIVIYPHFTDEEKGRELY